MALMTAEAPPPEELKQILALEEEVLWWDRPAPMRYVGGSLVLTVPLGLISVGSALSWVGWGNPAELPLWALVVLGLVALFAAHMLVFRPLLNLSHAHRMLYAVTDRRALVLCLGSKPLIHDLPHDSGRMVVFEGRSGQGKIKFARTAKSSLEVLIFGRAAIPGFYGLRDVKPVVSILEKLREEGGGKMEQGEGEG